jgi:hypothetical protein
MLDKLPINTNLLFNPLNWVIVILMLGMAAIAVSFIMAGLQSSQS